jgi:Protein of unknown function (DUF1822)
MLDEFEGLAFDLPKALQERVWQQSDRFRWPNSRWNAFLNALCLEVLQPWFQEALNLQAKVSRYSLPASWDIVNGTALQVGSRRCLLVPHESLDTSWLRVPQEWVSIPGWIADDYLGIQIDLSEELLKVWSYATHGQLVRHGHYDPSDRHCCLDEAELFTDMGLFWAAMTGSIALEEKPHEAPAPIPVLQTVQADNLLERLATAQVPRLELPETVWLAFIRHDGWRQRLYEKRQGLSEQISPLRWLKEGLQAFAQESGWQSTALVGAKDSAEALQIFQRTLQIANQSCQLRLWQQPTENWRFQLRPTIPDATLPPNTTLRLLTEDLKDFPGNQDRSGASQTELFIEVALDPGDGIVWMTDPLPEDYFQEILRF